MNKLRSCINSFFSFSKENIQMMLLYRMALIMILNTLCRVLFYVFNSGFYPDMSFGHFCHLLLGGMRFDILGLTYVNALYLIAMLIPFQFRYHTLYQSILKSLFIITNSIAIAANCIDIIYFRFTLRRTTAGVFQEFGNEGHLVKLFLDFFVQYWYMVLIFILFILIMVFSYGKVQKPKKFLKPSLYYPMNMVCMLLGFWLMIVSMRGMFTFMDRPITLSNAAEYTHVPIEMPLVQSTPTAIIKTLFNHDFEVYHFFESDEEMDSIYTPVKNHVPQNPFKSKNVVILIMESFGGEYVKAYNTNAPHIPSYTPFLDSLMDHALYYQHSFANGRKSIDGMPSILASIPFMETSYVLSPYSGNQTNGIAALLKEKGYNTAFFHGAPNGSMGFLAVANLLGFEHYYGMTEFNNNAFFDKTGGIFDEEFLQYYAETMNTMQQPFCTSVFTLSSHTPFTLPEQYKNRFNTAPTPFHNSLLYADYSLQRFFETASKMDWFQNTLFVIVADHGSTYSYHNEYKTASGIFSIPIVFYAPGDPDLKGCVNRSAQQIDILPSVLSYLNYEGKFIAFGNNLFANDSNDFIINYPGVPQLIWNDYLIHFEQDHITAIYNFKKDTFLTHNRLGQFPQIEKTMTLKMKAFLQQYTERIVQNRLTVKDQKKQ